MTDEIFMGRCLQLAKLGAGHVMPNPMVGAVLVYENKIIGEGYHRYYGEAHAEVNCINSVSPADHSLIQKSILYVSLEPCTHYGKTPPCADLIIQHKIPKVTIGCKDIYKEVNGMGIQKLKHAGIEVATGILEKECMDLNNRFFTFHGKKRPYIILKWAESFNGKIAAADHSRVMISSEFTNYRVHQWRSEEAAILVGTNTALYDNPSLNNRLWNGKSPARMVIDMNLRLPATLKLFNGESTTIIFNNKKFSESGNTVHYKIEKDSILSQMMEALYTMKMQSVLVEGGAATLQSFIDENLWDEARVIKSDNIMIEKGIDSPLLKNYIIEKKEKISSDTVFYYRHSVNNKPF